MTKYIDIPTAARRLNRTPQRVWQMCVAGKFPGAIKDKKTGWQIPASADILFTSLAPADLLECLDHVSIDKRDGAYRRKGICDASKQFVIAYLKTHQEAHVNDALAVFAEQQGISLRTLQRWRSKLRVEDIVGLVDTRGGGNDRMMSQDAWEMFRTLYLTPAQKPATLCYKELRHINLTENRGWHIPSLRLVQQRINTDIPLPVRVFYREGVAAYEAQCDPYIERDWNDIAPGEIWVGDHHQFNCWIRWRNRWVRPWLTAWQDMRSRKMVGWHVSCAPNQTTIMLAWRRGLQEFGPPLGAQIDNGRDYDSEMWTGTTKARRRAINAGYLDEPLVRGIYAMLGTSVTFSIPYHPQSKPIERTFDTFDKQFTKTFPTYCGKDSDRKPEHLNDYLKSDKARRDAYSLDSFSALVGEYIETVYNRNGHFGDGMNGQSPDQIFAQRTMRRAVANDVIELLLRVWSGRLKVSKNGVQFNHIHYGGADLMLHQGKMVRVAYDPDDITEAHIYDADSMKLIAIAECEKLVGHGPMAEEDIREASKRKARARRTVKNYRDARLVAGYDPVDLALRAQQAAALPAPEEVSPTRLQPVATGLEGQAQMAQRITQRKQLRRAVGSDLDSAPVFDLADLAGGRDEPRYETVFDWNDLSRPAPSAAADEKVFDL